MASPQYASESVVPVVRKTFIDFVGSPLEQPTNVDGGPLRHVCSDSVLVSRTDQDSDDGMEPLPSVMRVDAFSPGKEMYWPYTPPVVAYGHASPPYVGSPGADTFHADEDDCEKSKSEMLALENARLAKENQLLADHARLVSENTMLRQRLVGPGEVQPVQVMPNGGAAPSPQPWLTEPASPSPWACGNVWMPIGFQMGSPEWGTPSMPSPTANYSPQLSVGGLPSPMHGAESLMHGADPMNDLPRRRTGRNVKPMNPREIRAEDPVPNVPIEERSTVMLRNLPNNYTRQMLMTMLEQEGFAGKYDFLYLPIDFSTRASLGYAFINLISPSIVPAFWKTFENYSKWVVPSKKKCFVSWCGPHQGLQQHIERYRNSPVMHHSVPEEYKPVVLEMGLIVPFPEGTKKFRAPRIRNMRGQHEPRRHA